MRAAWVLIASVCLGCAKPAAEPEVSPFAPGKAGMVIEVVDASGKPVPRATLARSQAVVDKAANMRKYGFHVQSFTAIEPFGPGRFKIETGEKIFGANRQTEELVAAGPGLPTVVAELKVPATGVTHERIVLREDPPAGPAGDGGGS
jgi:hypothetical protein